MIAHINTAPYTLPLRQPTTCGDSRIRNGLIVALRDGAGQTAYGEVAPLPGLHHESVADAEAALRHAAVALRGWQGDDLAAFGTALVDAEIDLPSVRFGLEMAWVHLTARQRACTPAEVLGARTATVPINGLCDGGIDAVRRALHNGELAAYTVVKVKIGRRPTDIEREIVALLLDELPNTALRLDGNRAWSLPQTCALLRGLDVERIEYLEEPLQDPSALPALYRRTGVRIGLDETLREPNHTALHHADCVAAWILKPSALGGITTTIECADSTAAHCIVSSSFESGLGLWMLAQISARVAPGIAVGLGTDRWFADDLTEPPFCSTRGVVDLADACTEPGTAFTAANHLAQQNSS